LGGNQALPVKASRSPLYQRPLLKSKTNIVLLLSQATLCPWKGAIFREVGISQSILRTDRKSKKIFEFFLFCIKK